MIDTQIVRQQVTSLQSDVLDWKTGNNYNTLNKQQFIDKMKEKYNYLQENSCTLFDKCIDGSMDLPRLEQMLQMIEKVRQGYDFNSASVDIGQSLTDHYVKPLIENKNKK